MQHTSNYMLATGQLADHRLRLLNNLVGPCSRTFLKSIIKSGMRIAEIGCGTGNMLEWLSEKVGPQGKVYALDNSQDQLQVAADKIKKCQLNNVELIHDDAHELNKLPNDLDVIYCRLLLLHLKSPISSLQKMKACLTEEGYLVTEEMSMNTSFCYPHSEEYVRSRSLFNQLAELKGLDFNIGIKLEKMITGIDLELVNVNHFQSVLVNEADREMIWLAMQESGNQFINNQLITQTELNQLLMRLKKIANDHDHLITLPRLTQICSKKTKLV